MRVSNLLAAGAALFLAQPSLACNATGNTATVAVGALSSSDMSWNPLPGGVEATATFNLNVTRGGTTRSVRIIFRDESATSPAKLGQTGPAYTVNTSANSGQFAFPAGTTANSSNGFILDLPNNNATPLQFIVRVGVNTAGTDFTGGTPYQDALTYSVQCYSNAGGTGAVGSGITGTAVSPKATIMKVLSASLTGQTTTGEVDFGSFSTLAPAALNIAMRSTSTIDVTVSSAKGLRMVRDGAPTTPADNEVIPYTMSLDGRTISATPTSYNAPRVGVASRNWPLQLALPSTPTGKRAGNYRDTITISLTPGI